LFGPILVEPTTFLHLSSSSDTIIRTKGEDSRGQGRGGGGGGCGGVEGATSLRVAKNIGKMG